MTKRIFQYASTTDPEVLAVLDRNEQGWLECHQKAIAFSQAQGVEDGSYYSGGFGGTVRLSGIASEDKPQSGQWKRSPRGRGWVPYKNNPLYAQYEEIEFKNEPVPGLPGLIYGPSTFDGRRTMYTTHPFAHEGVAWVGLSGAPDLGSINNKEFGEQWSEELASKYHAAREARIAADEKVAERENADA